MRSKSDQRGRFFSRRVYDSIIGNVLCPLAEEGKFGTDSRQDFIKIVSASSRRIFVALFGLICGKSSNKQKYFAPSYKENSGLNFFAKIVARKSPLLCTLKAVGHSDSFLNGPWATFLK